MAAQRVDATANPACGNRSSSLRPPHIVFLMADDLDKLFAEVEAEVADAVLATVRRPQFETWVPGYAKGLFYGTNTFPRRVRDAISHALRADSSLSAVDTEARAEYERRASR